MLESGLDGCLALVRAAREQQGAAREQALAALEAAIIDLSAGQQPVITLDLAGYVTGWNRGAEALFGYTETEALGRHALFLDAEDAAAAGMAGLFMQQGGAALEVQCRKKSGEVIRVAMALSMIHDNDNDNDGGGAATGMLVQLSPLADALSAQDKVRLHGRIIEDSDQGVLITDCDERIVSVNGAFTRITGYTAAESIGQTADLLRSGVHDAGLRARVHAALQGLGPWRGEIVGKRKNGAQFPQSVTISVVRNARGDITHSFSLLSDISVHKDAEARMQRMANYDSLTGLPNRSLFSHLVDQMLIEARRARTSGESGESGDCGALMVIEVDRIGAFSDTLGHDIASALLCEIGRRLREALRDADILARTDGSKFAVALPTIEKRQHAGVVARKLLATLPSRF